MRAGSDQSFQNAAQRRSGGWRVGLCLVPLEVSPGGERISGATNTRARTHSDSPESIGDDMKLVPGAVAVLLVAGDGGGHVRSVGLFRRGGLPFTQTQGRIPAGLEELVCSGE